MYPNLYYAFKDIFGVEWYWLRVFNSFGFFVAIAFILAAIVLAKELKRKEQQGLLLYTEQTIMVGKSASIAELLLNFALGFLLGFKLIGLFTSDSELVRDPQEFIFSREGNLPVGILLGLLLVGLKWWEKNKQKLPKPEQRKVRIWPHDRIGDIVIYAAIFGFAGAKIFHNLENWDELVKNPIESLFSFSGLTFYGGLICAALAIAYYAKKHKIGFRHLCDAAAPALMLAYAIGRLGCQVSGDGDWGIVNSAYITGSDSRPVLASPSQFTQVLQENKVFYSRQHDSLGAVHHKSVVAPSFLPTWTVAYAYPHNVIGEGVSIPGCSGNYCAQLPIPVFPTPFYETVACLLLFLLLWLFRKKFTVPGTFFGFYLVLNGIERFFIEKIRVNTEYNIIGFHPTQAEIISVSLFVAGIFLIFFLRRRSQNPKLD